jgi:hypothetical protein
VFPPTNKFQKDNHKRLVTEGFPMIVGEKKFDLNIEEILEDWEVYHAVREIIANALDEEVLTKTRPIEIKELKRNKWSIRDFGRGLKYEHLTQKEDKEKLENPNVIGKFGVGLKDALATFERHGVGVFIKSKFCDITLVRSEKHAFEDIVTLHANIVPPSDPDFVGTEVVLDRCSVDDIVKAKDLFLRFSGEGIIEDTEYGEVLEKKGDTSRIYVNGVKVAEENNFLFSYNITSLNKQIRTALNRERTNVGRTAYANRVKSILLACGEERIAQRLVDDLRGFDEGTIHDEVKWADVSAHAVKILNSLTKAVFLTPGELISAANMVDRAKKNGYEIVTIPENVKNKISGTQDFSGEMVRDLNQFGVEWHDSFEFNFIEQDSLTENERAVFKATDHIFRLIGGIPEAVREIKISTTMRLDPYSFREASGFWDSTEGRIVIKRDQLRSLINYAGTLLHEAAHAESGCSDMSTEFEDQLTSYLGLVIDALISRNCGSR